jgi:tetratricopeptide (TPR) repeat protein
MLLSTLFCLLGIILFLKAATSQRNNYLYISALFVVSLLGAASRENFAAFPLLLLLYDLIFVSRFRLGEIKNHWKAYLPPAAGILYLAFLTSGHTYDVADQYLGEGIPPLRYVLTQFKVHWSYLRLLVLPVGQNIDPDYTVSRSLLEAPTLVSLLGYLALLAAGVATARKRPVSAFGVLWFLAALLPVSFVPSLLHVRLDDAMLEHRLYLPSAGIFVMVSALAVHLRGRLSSIGARKAATAVVAVLVLVLAAAAHQRNEVWQSGVSLWGDVVRKSPQKVRGYNNLGNAYGRLGDYDSAIANLEKALTLRPEMPVSRYYYAEIHYNLAVLYDLKGMTGKAGEHYKASIGLRPSADAFNNLGVLYMKRGLTDAAVGLFQYALTADPGYVNAHFNLGEAYLRKNAPAMAVAQYLEFLRHRPDHVQAHLDIAEAYRRAGDEDKAAEHERIAEALRRRQ